MFCNEIYLSANSKYARDYSGKGPSIKDVRTKSRKIDSKMSALAQPPLVRAGTP